MAKKPLRSAKSYGKHDKDGFIHRSWNRELVGSLEAPVGPSSGVWVLKALVRTGDEIAFDGPNRTLDLLVDEAELARRRAAWEAARQPSPYTRG
jgi:hypothetical protein